MINARFQGNPPNEAREWSDEQKIDTCMDFHKLFYDSPDKTWQTMTWMGVPVQKNPMDLWVYQELIYRNKPDLIIECGTYAGGSALYMACLLHMIGDGAVVTVDINPIKRTKYDNLIYYTGSSTDPETLSIVGQIVKYRSAKRVMVILDSDHEMNHVLREMELYSPLVTPEQYMIVEDTNLNGYPVWSTYGPGPREAIKAFLPHHPEFIVDSHCERLMLTFNSGGYLLKTSHGSTDD